MPDREPRASHQIGDVAERMHLSLRTLRYWEEVGLIEPSGRSTGGYRVYSGEDVERISLIRSMKVADFTIEELRELMGLVNSLRSRDQDAAGQADAIDRLDGYIRRLRERCEVVRARVAEAERAAIDLESLLVAARQGPG